MSNDMVSLARTQIDHFEQSVKETIEHAEELKPIGRYKARTPLVNHFYSKHLLDYLSPSDDEITDLITRFEAVESEFEDFRAEMGDEYDGMLTSELKYLLGKYPRLICHFMELDPIYLELVNHLDIRDGLEILLIELNEITDIEKVQIKVKALDEVFACEYDENLREILELVELEEQSSIELDYLPSRFWWRHPSEHEKWWEMIDDSAPNDTR